MKRKYQNPRVLNNVRPQENKPRIQKLEKERLILGRFCHFQWLIG